MKNVRAIWQHEVRQAKQVSSVLMEPNKIRFGLRSLILPIYISDVVGYRRNLRQTRNNLLFTKELAFNAVENIHKGKEPAWEFRQIEIKTQDILDKEKKGLYSGKIRRKQLIEIEFLINHYQELIKTGASTYQAMIASLYPKKGTYIDFLNRLQSLEAEVIQVAVTSMRKGSKKERRQWFDKLTATTRKIRIDEAQKIYAKP
jgi:hypothetical protein